jgi:hypothetical protein
MSPPPGKTPPLPAWANFIASATAACTAEVHSRFPSRQHTYCVYDVDESLSASIQVVHPVTVMWLTLRFCGGVPCPITVVIGDRHQPTCVERLISPSVMVGMCCDTHFNGSDLCPQVISLPLDTAKVRLQLQAKGAITPKYK